MGHVKSLMLKISIVYELTLRFVHAAPASPQLTNVVRFQESLLHGKILPCGILDGFTVKLGASGLFMPKQVVLPVTTFWFNVSEHQAASPYLVRRRTPVSST